MNVVNIENHISNLFDINLSRSNLKFKILTTGTFFFKEIFYWALIYFSDKVYNNPNDIFYYSKLILLILFLQIPIEQYTNTVTNKFISDIKIKNSIFFYKRLTNINKNKILNMDLIFYNNIVEHFNDNIEQYILNKRVIYSLPLRFIGLCIIAYNKKINYLIPVFFLYCYIIDKLNSSKYKKEKILIDNVFIQENIIREYITHSKNLLLNDNLNMNYLKNNINNFENSTHKIYELETTYETIVNIIILLYILFIMYSNINKLDPKNFLYYFLIVFDVEYISDKITSYYKNKIDIIKLEKKLNYLYSYSINPDNTIQKIDISNIVIKKIINLQPKLKLENIIINKNDNILVSGPSGCGKTSFLYILKGIIKPDYIDISPSIEHIISQSYISRAEDNNIPSGILYNIVSNYSSNPNEEIILYAIKISKFKIQENVFVNTNTISSGENIRLLIARLIYTILINDYKILLFDEIDEHLNNELALYICNSIKKIFHDRIIIYISHNEEVKKKFTKTIIFNNGKIQKTSN